MYLKQFIAGLLLLTGCGLMDAYADTPANSLATTKAPESNPAPAATPQTTVLAPVRDALISLWSNEIIVSVYTFDATNSEENLKKVARYFTSEGWPVFIKAVGDSKILETVKQNQYQVTAVALEPPRILSKTVINGQYTWTVSMPALVSYHNQTSQFKQYLDITLTIVDAGAKSGIRGLALTQFMAKQVEKPTLCHCD